MILLINPPIYDFTAYDLWAKPLGLLYVGGILRKMGLEIELVDALGNYDGVSAKVKSKGDGRGNFRREIVKKPEVLAHIPRHYARYGISRPHLEQMLEGMKRPDAIFVTSIMTYWYPGVMEVMEICRKIFPGTPIVLGGIYATLLPEHARAKCNPDILAKSGENIATILDELNISHKPFEQARHITDMPRPATDLIPNPEYGIVMTTRGCPKNCSFCAQRLLYPRFERRSPDDVVDEILDFHRSTGVIDFAFYDDALFTDSDIHIKPILGRLQGKGLRLHSPNGLFAGLIDRELAGLMRGAGFSTIRLSLESIDPALFGDMSGKINPDSFAKGVENLIRVGYRPEELGAYIMMGLPGQQEIGVMDTIDFLHRMHLPIKLSIFSPVPGTRAFRKAVEMGLLRDDTDPLLTNETAYSLSRSKDEWEHIDRIRDYVRSLNQDLRS